MFSFSLLAGILTFYFHQKLGGIDTAIPLARRLGNAALSYASYIEKMFWPANLAVFYPYQDPLPAVGVIASVVLLLLITAGVLYLRSRKPYFLTGWFWYLGTLVPVIGIIQAGSQAMADRYTYIPLIGLFIMISWGTHDLAPKLSQRKIILPIAAAAVLAALTAVAWKQIGFWRSSIALYKHAVEVTSDNYMAHHHVGVFYVDQGRIAEALPHFAEAIRAKPDYAIAHVGLGNALMLQGKLDEGERQFREAMRIQPNLMESYLGIATVLKIRGKMDEGIVFLQKALDIHPKYSRAYFLMGEIMYAQGKTDAAIAHYRKAIELNPLYSEAYSDWGIALRSQGRIPEAMAQYREAIRLNPKNVSASLNLGNILVSQGQIGEGIRQFQAVLEIDPRNINALNRLGSALLIQGKTAEAASCFQRVLSISPQERTAVQAMHYIESNLKRRANR